MSSSCSWDNSGGRVTKQNHSAADGKDLNMGLGETAFTAAATASAVLGPISKTPEVAILMTNIQRLLSYSTTCNIQFAGAEHIKFSLSGNRVGQGSCLGAQRGCHGYEDVLNIVFSVQPFFMARL